MISVSRIKAKLFNDILKQQFDKLHQDQDYIGSGMQGEVKKAVREGELVAIKFFRKQCIAADIIRYIQSEIQTLQEVRHENILELIDSYKVIQNNFIKYCIVTQFCESSLAQYSHIQKLSEFDRLDICRQMVTAIKVAHQHKIMHRDIKPQNILIKYVSKMNIKVADFGCSRTYDSQQIQMTSGIGTPLYTDPNVNTGNYSQKCDVYSLGLVIIYIFCGNHPLSHCKYKAELQITRNKLLSNIEEQTRLFLKNYKLSNQIQEFLVQIACLTLVQSQEQRFSSQSLLEFIQNQIQNYSVKYSELSNQSRFSIGKLSMIQIEKSNLMKKKPFNKEQAHQNFESQLGLQQYEPSKINTEQQKNQDSSHQTEKNSQNSKEQFKSQHQQSTQISYERSFDKQKSNESGDRQISNKDFDSVPQSLNESGVNRSQFVKPNKSFLTPGNQQIRQTPSESKFIKQNDNDSDTNIFKKSVSDSCTPKKSLIKQKMFGNLKTNSAILQQNSRIQAKQQSQKFQRQKQAQIKRKSLIEQNDKILSESQKLSSTIIMCQMGVTNQEQELQTMRKILINIRSNKNNFQSLSKINQLGRNEMNFDQKKILAFLVHYFYIQKLEDYKRFTEGKRSHVAEYLNIQLKQISNAKIQRISQIVDLEVKRVVSNFIKYASQLRRIVDLIRPRLSENISSMITDIWDSREEFRFELRPEIVKAEIITFVQSKIRTCRNGQDEAILRSLLKTTTKII